MNIGGDTEEIYGLSRLSKRISGRTTEKKMMPIQPGDVRDGGGYFEAARPGWRPRRASTSVSKFVMVSGYYGV